MNYIPADKLIAEIERLAKSYQDPIFITVRGNTANNFRDNLLSFITSLQQEQPDVDEDFFFDEVLNVYDSNGVFPPQNNEALTMLENIARHFYELGLNTRKDE